MQGCLDDPESCFSAGEFDKYREFTVPKRKMEWLASRILVKNLVANSLDLPQPSSLRAIIIRKMPSGVPFVEIEGIGRVGWLSFSHSNDGVLAAFSQAETQHFGVDLEFLEDRSPLLIEDYFTESESKWVNACQVHEKRLAANLIWSAKEAFLKANEKGLQLDTRRIEIKPFAFTGKESNWQSLEFTTDILNLQPWRLFFRWEADFVMTMCLPADNTSKLTRIILSPLNSDPE